MLSDHAFVRQPHRTFFRLSVPVLFSLVAEPLTGLVDTAFVARLGSVSLAALGVGTMALSALFWMFNFLGIATQTEVARADGRGERQAMAEDTSLALTVAAVLGVLTAAILFPLTSAITSLMGASGDIQAQADAYVRIRWAGAPAVVLVVAGFGAMRGMQDMKSPMWIAAGINGANIVLDWLLIFGVGPFPELGIQGAAIATVTAQWIAAVATLVLLGRRLEIRPYLEIERLKRLFRIGGDLFVRTGMLTLFLLIATRQATRIGAEAGAAHQAIRQFWIFTALFLDSFAIAGQSLVAFFRGTARVDLARRVARVVCGWSLATGIGLALIMWVGRDIVAGLLVPAGALAAFHSAWWAAALTQPFNALTFGTDGIHWGTGDFRYLRNATVVATALGASALFTMDPLDGGTLMGIWIVTGGWILVRTGFGVFRLWPGNASAPLGSARADYGSTEQNSGRRDTV